MSVISTSCLYEEDGGALEQPEGLTEGEDSAASLSQHQSSCIFSWGIQLKLCLGLAR